MNTITITLIATILGVDGSLVRIDLGHVDGLRRNDVGSVYYEVASDSGVETVAVGAVRVVATSDLGEWHEVLHFEADTFARSFEIVQGDMYFGMGADRAVSAGAGNVLRVGSDHFLIPPSPLISKVY